MTPTERIEAVAEAAAAWQDPEHPARDAAVAATLEAPNRFTEEGLAFALNHLMHLLRPEALRAWIGEPVAPRTVGVVVLDEEPLAGLQDALAAYLLGHRVVVSLPALSPALLPAFFDEVGAGSDVRFTDRRRVLAEADLLVATVEEAVRDEWEERCEEAGIGANRRLLRRARFAVAVVDGHEDREARSGLAEDLLLHEGVGRYAARLLWAPRDQPPDPYLDALAGFREVFPPHPDTDGTLSMPAAFLAAAAVPRATGPGFLLSRGEPEAQASGHLRWTEYGDLGEVEVWLRAQRDEILFVVATPRVAEQLDVPLPVVGPGDAHRLPLGWHREGEDVVAFLAGS